MSEIVAHYLSQKENVKKHFALALREVAQVLYPTQRYCFAFFDSWSHNDIDQERQYLQSQYINPDDC